MGAHPDGEKDAVSLTDSFGRLALALELHQPDLVFTLMTPYEGKLLLLD